MAATRPPIYVGMCLVNTEAICVEPKHTCRTSFAGVRFVQPSSADENCFVPASDVYARLTVKDAQELSRLFSGIARQLQEIEP